jgi:ornithine cyclodeaminase
MGAPHETDIAVLHEVDALIVDDLAFACVQGDIAAWIRRGELDRAEIPGRVRANIGEVLANLKPGRTHPDERILAVIQGLTACDVVMAKAVVDRAIAEGAGQTLTL